MTTQTRTKRSPEKIAAEVEQLTEALGEKVVALANSDEWRRMLKAAGRFHNYSFRNIMLLFLQAEEREMEITRVAGFGTWKSLGYMVRRGERSLAVLAPMKRRLSAEEAADRASKGEPAYDGEGRPAMVIRGFRLERVFDRSQVDPIPGLEPAPLDPPTLVAHTGAGPAGLLDCVCDLIRAEGFTVDQRPPTPGDGSAHGSTNYARHIVWLRSDVDDAEQARIALHELGHIRCQHGSREISRGQRECEAESVAAVAGEMCGLNIDDSSVEYLTGWTNGEAKVIEAAAQTIKSAAQSIVADLHALIVGP